MVINVSFSQKLSDNALAFSLAHEMSHSVLHHSEKRVTRLLSRSKEVPASLNDLPASTPEDEVVFRSHEFEADELGFSVATAAGFDAASGLVESLTQPTVVQEASTSHPSVSSRIAKFIH